MLQDTFLYLYRKASLFDPLKGSAKAWIVQVAAHRALDKKSWLARRGFYAGTELDSVTDTFAGTTNLEREIGDSISRTALERAFSELPSVQREMIRTTSKECICRNASPERGHDASRRRQLSA